MQELITYNESWDIRGSFLFIIGTFLTALLVGIAYTYASIYVPSIYLAVLLTVWFPLGVIYTAEYLSKILKIQHSGYVKGIVFAALFVAFLVSWIVWISYHTGRGFFPLNSILQHLANPITLWRDMLMLLGRGTRTIDKSNTIQGILLWVLWVIEAGIILWTSRFMSGKQAKKPFRSSTDDWAIHQSISILSQKKNFSNYFTRDPIPWSKLMMETTNSIAPLTSIRARITPTMRLLPLTRPIMIMFIARKW